MLKRPNYVAPYRPVYGALMTVFISGVVVVAMVGAANELTNVIAIKHWITHK